MQLITWLALCVFGAVFGSFAGATVWRLRAKQLQYDQKNGEPVNKAEYKRLKPLLNGFSVKDRSRCLSCQHTLAWYDMLPLVSWLSTGGRCRYCKTLIGGFELMIEIMTATLFVLSYVYWPFTLASPLAWLQFGVWLAVVVGLVVIFWYDAKWFLVLWVTIWPLLLLGLVFVALAYAQAPSSSMLLSTAAAVVLLAGLYWLLWAVSKGRWVGLGDAQIGAVLGLVLLDWQKAFLALILANAIGTMIVLPALLTKKISRSSAVPFGALLITGALVSFFWGSAIIAWFTVDFSLWLGKLMYPY